MSRLLNVHSPGFRKTNMARNLYDDNNKYESGHERAVSDGDEWGKDENNGSVGGATDILKRTQSLARNTYSPNNEYNSSNA
jgi:hypothetical protein